MKNMIDNKAVAPDAEGNTDAGGVKREVTFLWAEADEWKPAMEAREIAEEANVPISLT